jgi:hypothetical protein
METTLQQRKLAFVQLGNLMGKLATETSWPGFTSGLTETEFDEFTTIFTRHIHVNGWFTEQNIRKALLAWSAALSAENLDRWLSAYQIPDLPSKQYSVGIICAGNIPMVGFHDVLSVILSGHRALVKLSSDDNLLIPALWKLLLQAEPGLEGQLEFVPAQLKNFDAVIATGSNNTSRYFKYYFDSVPHIIRKSRNSLAILNGNESEKELQELGKDIFDYFGLGCRNVTKVYLPESFNLDKLFNAIFPFADVINHNKYANNYDYNKAVWLLNREDLLDNGFILLKKDEVLASPTASLYYEYYQDEVALRSLLASHSEEIQCMISQKDLPFGTSQSPMLWDYADGVDTLDFLLKLK